MRAVSRGAKAGRVSLMTVGLPVAVLAAAQTKEAVRTTSAKKTRVLHMANPRRDTFNLQVADVLAPR